MTLDLHAVILDGTKAPSGENCQPWRFVVKNRDIYVYNDPHADVSLYNTAQKGSFVAIGACIENMVLSAREKRFEAGVNLFPNDQDANLVAVIRFSQGAAFDPLYRWIHDRCTNRREYEDTPLTQVQKQLLIQTARNAGVDARIVDGKDMSVLGQAVAVNERVLFENRALHDFFYQHLLWDKNEQCDRSGFYIETLEFLPRQLKAVKLLSSWTLLKFLNATIGIGNKIASENAAKYIHGSMLAIMVNGRAPQDFVRAGRALERIWLTATQFGLAIHPCTGVLYLYERIIDGDGDVFSPLHRSLIEKAYLDIQGAFGATGRAIPMLMRIGHATQPSARSDRFPLPRVMKT